jgi:hypothetical protein
VTVSNCSNAANNGTFFISGQPGVGIVPSSGIGWVNANGVTPDNGVGGSVGAPTINWSITNLVPWFSDVAHISIQVQVPGGWTEAQFQAAVGKIFPVLDSIIPAWATWDWWRVDSVHNVQGFWLDSPHNLDNDAFDQ